MKSIMERLSDFCMIDPNSGCWVWTGGVDQDGYGKIRVDNKVVSAHRLSYKEYVGDIPGAMCVLHKCDCPPCIRPEHLFLGTKADNNADRCAKGRNSNRRGERHHMVKLDSVKIAEIRAFIASGLSQRNIARKYGVGQSHISRIKIGNRWPHLA